MAVSLDELFANLTNDKPAGNYGVDRNPNPFSVGANPPDVKGTPVQDLGEGPELKLSPIEIEALVSAVRIVPSSDVAFLEARKIVFAIVDEFNMQRYGDPIGTLRKDPGSDKYAFAYERGRYLLVDTATGRPAYRSASDLQAQAAKRWPVAS